MWARVAFTGDIGRHPSSDLASLGHLLPQGEKERAVEFFGLGECNEVQFKVCKISGLHALDSVFSECNRSGPEPLSADQIYAPYI